MSTPSTAPPPEDVDSYEQRIAGPRWWAWALGLSLAGAAAYGAVVVRERMAAPQPFTGREREPNDRAPEANAVPYGQRVTGGLGRRIDADRSDRDFFRIIVPEGSGLVALSYRALPNIAPCLFVYPDGRDEPIHRLCVGQAGRNLQVPALRITPGTYLFALMQDRERYTEDPRPPVLENISDSYELEVAPSEASADLEVEPNDQRASANLVSRGSVLRGRLAWMRDTDLYCADIGPEALSFVVEEPGPRARGAVLEVTPLGGPADGIPVRIHPSAANGTPTERDVRSPFTSPPVKEGRFCVSLALSRDVWSSPPLPLVPPAGDQEYLVRLVEAR